MKRVRAALVATVVAALLAAGIIVWASPVLGLRTVDVAGPGAATLSAQVRHAVDVPSGTPLARIDLSAVQRRVAAVGAVATASVRRQWPHALSVTVTARTPVAVTQADGHWWLVDASGTPYAEVATPPAGLMPLRLATPGRGDRATLAALGVLAALSPAIRAQVTAVTAPAPYDVSLTLRDGRTVVWGSDTDAAVKNAVLPALLKRPGTTFDISDPTLATVH